MKYIFKTLLMNWFIFQWWSIGLTVLPVRGLQDISVQAVGSEPLVMCDAGHIFLVGLGFHSWHGLAAPTLGRSWHHDTWSTCAPEIEWSITQMGPGISFTQYIMKGTSPHIHVHEKSHVLGKSKCRYWQVVTACFLKFARDKNMQCAHCI